MTDQELATELGQLLRRLKFRLAVAESLTAGNVQALVSSVRGASEWFVGGVTAYTLQSKVDLLHVDPNHAREVNCVSERVAREMAAGACNLFGAEVAIATTGYASDSPSGFPIAHIGFLNRAYGNSKFTLVALPFDTDRLTAQQRFARAIVSDLLDSLRSLGTPE